MPAEDGLHGMPPADLTALMRDLRALREREGLSLEGGWAAPGELPPGGGPRRPRWRPSAGMVGVMAAALALAGLAAGGAVLTEPTGHSEISAPGTPLPGGGRSMASHGGRMHPRPVPPAEPRPRSTPARPERRARVPERTRVRVVVPHLVPPPRPGTAVAGAGCPDSEGDGVSLDAAATGPGWTAAGGGWTGNGCDGSSVWTMDPNGNQPSPSTLTWFFHPAARASACHLDVFVPSQNALGVASYEITDGAADLGDVSVDQAASAGQWITLGSYPVARGVLAVQVQPGPAVLTAAMPGNGGNGKSGNGGSGNSGNGGSGNSGNGGNGNSGNGGNGHAQGSGNGGSGGTGHGGSGAGHPSPSPSPAGGHHAAVAASVARASCG